MSTTDLVAPQGTDAFWLIWHTAHRHRIGLHTAAFVVARSPILTARQERSLYP